MATYRCTRCNAQFESDERRCPTCLRKSGVVGEGDPRWDDAGRRPSRPSRPTSLLAGPGILVTLVILVPFVVLVPGRPLWQTFGVAFVAFGAGHLINHAWSRRG